MGTSIYCICLHFYFSYLRQLFRNLFHKQGFTYDYVFDWNIVKFGGTRPDSDPAAITGTSANAAAQELAKERKNRNQRSATGMPANALPIIAGPVEVGTPKPGSMPPMVSSEMPFGAAQPPLVSPLTSKASSS